MRLAARIALSSGVAFLLTQPVYAQRGGRMGGGFSSRGSFHFSGRVSGRPSGRSTAPRSFSLPGSVRMNGMPGPILPGTRGALGSPRNVFALPTVPVRGRVVPRPVVVTPARVPLGVIQSSRVFPFVRRPFIVRPFAPIFFRQIIFFHPGFGFPFCSPIFGFGFGSRHLLLNGSFGCFGSPFFCDPFFQPCFVPFAPAFAAPVLVVPPAVGFAGEFVPVPVTGQFVDRPERGEANAFSEAGETDAALPAENTPASEISSSVTGKSEVPVTLLQLKDGSMYGLTDYWVEDDRLHYVTNYGGENSVPLEDIDFASTIQLNDEQGTEFSLYRKRADSSSTSHKPTPPQL